MDHSDPTGAREARGKPPMPKLNPSLESHGNRLQRLRSFCYAAQTGSISRAAEQAMLSQPSVSLQIQALELEFKAKLFQRRGPKIQLTPDGQALYKLAWPLVEALDSLTADLPRRPQRHRVGPAQHRRRRIHDPLHPARDHQPVRRGLPRHRAAAPERHRPGRPEDAPQRRRRLRRRVDDRGPRGYQLHPHLPLRSRC